MDATVFSGSPITQETCGQPLVGIALNMHASSSGPDSLDIDRHLELGRFAYGCGFDSLFVFEHHFSGYILSPSPLVTLAYLAGIAPGAILGTSVILLPAHDDRRLVEDISVLDNLAHGKVILGLGSGRSEGELKQLGVSKDSASDEFPIRVNRLASLLAESTSVPSSCLRPRPAYRPQDRIFTASSEPVERMGGGHFPQLINYRHDTRFDSEAIVFAPISIAELCSEARSSAQSATEADLIAIDLHYGSNLSTDPKSVPRALADQIVGAPQEVDQQIAHILSQTGTNHLVLEFSFGNRSFNEAREMLELFSNAVMPKLRGSSS